MVRYEIYLLRYDGGQLETVYWGDFDFLLSSPAFGADGSMTIHAGRFLINYGFEASMQWYAVLASDPPADDWILSSPTWVWVDPNDVEQGGIVLVVDPVGGSLWAIQSSVGPGNFEDSYPLFHGDDSNSGSGY